MAFDIYQEITNRIIEQLEQGIIPWNKPWTGTTDGAISHESGKPYSILNQFLLAKPGEYITFNQAKKEGGKIKKGAKSKMVVFWKLLSRQEKTLDNKPVFDGEGKPIMKMIPILKYFNVFSLDDAEGIKPKITQEKPIIHANPIQEAERVFQDYLSRTGCKFKNVAGDKAYYSPTFDEIVLPLMEQFPDTAEYYSTLFHETTHSTGYVKRLNRFAESVMFGDEDYAKEELTAEIGAASMLHILGIERQKSFENSAAYIQSWLGRLKNDKKLIVGASARADKAIKLILNEQEQKNEQEAA